MSEADDELARKLEHYERHRPIALPYPSVAEAWAKTGKVLDSSAAATRYLAVLAPTEVLFDAGPCRSRRLDSEFYDEYLARTGHRPRSKDMDATWLGTDEALWYANGVLRCHHRWPWSEVLLGSPRPRLRARVTLVVPGRSLKLELGPAALANLLAIRKWALTPSIGD